MAIKDFWLDMNQTQGSWIAFMDVFIKYGESPFPFYNKILSLSSRTKYPRQSAQHTSPLESARQLLLDS